MFEINTLVIGLEEKKKALLTLPVNFRFMDNAQQAVNCLRQERINNILSKWHLYDAPDGELLERIRQAKPAIPIVAFIQPGRFDQEIAARSAGVTMVLYEDIDEEELKEVLRELLGLTTVCRLEKLKETALHPMID